MTGLSLLEAPMSVHRPSWWQHYTTHPSPAAVSRSQVPGCMAVTLTRNGSPTWVLSGYVGEWAHTHTCTLTHTRTL